MHLFVLICVNKYRSAREHLYKHCLLLKAMINISFDIVSGVVVGVYLWLSVSLRKENLTTRSCEY